LPAAHARIAIDAGRYYVTPGLIDIQERPQPDYLNLRNGVTKVVPPSAQAQDPARGAQPRANMITMLSKLLTQGLTLEQVIERATVIAAKAAGKPELGTLSEGAVADIALIELEPGKFTFREAGRTPIRADRRLECVLTIRNGIIVWDPDGLSAPDQSKAGPYSNFK
jgi:predicted amidohydrolase